MVRKEVTKVPASASIPRESSHRTLPFLAHGLKLVNGFPSSGIQALSKLLPLHQDLEPVKLYACPLRTEPQFPTTLQLSDIRSFGYQSQTLRGLIFSVQNPWAVRPHVGTRPLVLRECRYSCGSWLNHSSALLPISMWLFLYILSGVWHVQLVFSLVSEIVVLQVIVDISVSTVGGELRIFLLHHLNPKIILLHLKAVGKWLHNVIFPVEFPNPSSIWVWTHFLKFFCN